MQYIRRIKVISTLVDKSVLVNALANFDTPLSPWTNATDWLASNTDSVVAILHGLVCQESSLSNYLMGIMIYKVRCNLDLNAYYIA